MGQTNFGYGKIAGQKILVKKKCWVKKRILSPVKTILYKKILGPKKFWAQKNLGSRTIFSLKKFWVKKIKVQKIIGKTNN